MLAHLDDEIGGKPLPPVRVVFVQVPECGEGDYPRVEPAVSDLRDSFSRAPAFRAADQDAVDPRAVQFLQPLQSGDSEIL